MPLSGGQAEPNPRRDDENRYRYLVENVFDIIVECAASGRILYVSPNIRDVLGWEPAEIIGSFMNSLVHPDDVPVGMNAFFSAISRRERLQAALRYRHKSGDWRMIEGRGKAYMNAAGKARVVIIGRDVTARVVAEEQLRATQQRMQLQMQQIPVAIIGWDLERKITEWNPAAERLFGYPRHQMLGKPARKVLPSTTPAAEALLDTINAQVFATREPVRVTADLMTKSGPSLTCEWTIVPVLDDAKEISAFLTIAQDLSDRHLALRLEEFAYQDPVTGMPNRRLFDDRLAACVAAGHRKDDAFALLYVDLDDFKAVNDSFGHHVGDAVLAAVGLRLRVCVRDSDVVARLGGDEFGVLLPRVERAGYAEDVAARIVETLRKPLEAIEMTVHVSASIGISQFPADGMDADSLLRRADAAMYRAKQKGKSTYSL